ncbi:MAG: hypothetical protein LBK68_02020 [Candidatus Margulisbacteria bacterium]|nr:hypothetical protein [Candidatus Margulisiibacteriota bacterium]
MANASNYTDTTDIDFKGENYNIDTGKSLSAEGMRNALHTKENVTNKTDVIDSNNSSNAAQYPSVKAVYDLTVHKDGTQTITGVKTFGTVDAAAEPVLGVAKTTDATDSGTKFATEAQVYKKQDKVTVVQQSALDSGITASKVSAYDSYFANLSFFPRGTILTFNKDAWDAKDEIFKSIWKVCDGTNNTPNLIDKFLRGAEYPANRTGGADSQSITLTTSNLPAHNHTMQDAGNHTHYPQPFDGRMNFDACGGGSGAPQGIGYGDNMYAGYTTTLTLSEAGSHAHTINNSGGGTAFTVNTVPAHYTVIYIMKIS